MTSVPSPSHTRPVLVLTRDTGLVAELRRLAAAAGAPVDVVDDPVLARPLWPVAPVVLVGPDLLLDLGATTPARRDGVHVVANEAVPDELFRAALAVGAETVVELPSAESWLVQTLAESADGESRQGRVVGVMGGCGGAGATTFAAALAVAAASEVPAASGIPAASDVRPVTLVDADPLGPGIEHVAGLDDLEGARWGQLLESTGRLGSRSLLSALPRRDALTVLGWGAGARVGLRVDVVREVLSAAQRGSALVVVDLPRYLDGPTEELVHACEEIVLVTTLTLPAVASAAQVVARVLRDVPRGHLVARGPASALDPHQVAAALGMPLAAVMPDQRGLDEAVETGLGPLRARRGPLARAARATLEVLA